MVFSQDEPMKIPFVLAMKIWWIRHENLVNFPWINSQDFYGFLFSSARGFLCWENRTPTSGFGVALFLFSEAQELRCSLYIAVKKRIDRRQSDLEISSKKLRRKVWNRSLTVIRIAPKAIVNRRAAVIKPVVLTMLRLLSISTLATATICRSNHVKMANNQANIAVYD